MWKWESISAPLIQKPKSLCHSTLGLDTPHTVLGSRSHGRETPTSGAQGDTNGAQQLSGWWESKGEVSVHRHLSSSVILGGCGMSSGTPKRHLIPQRALHRWANLGLPRSRKTSLFLPSTRVLVGIPSPLQLPPLAQLPCTHRPCAYNSLQISGCRAPWDRAFQSWLTLSLPSSARGQVIFLPSRMCALRGSPVRRW